MREDEADALAHQMNRDLGARGPTSSFYVAVQTSPAEWDVELRTGRKRPWWKRVAEAILENLTP